MLVALAALAAGGCGKKPASVAHGPHGDAAAAPLERDSGRPPEPPSASEPAPEPLLDLEADGCFAWSSAEQTLACNERFDSIADGCRHSLVFFGAHPTRRFRTLAVPSQCLGEQTPALDAASRKEVDARVASFARLSPPAGELSPGETLTVGGVVFGLARTKRRTVRVIDGEWDVVDDVVTMTCGAKKRRVMAFSVEGAHDEKGALLRIVDLGAPWLAVWYWTHWGREGDIGSRTEVALVDATTCRAHRP